MPGRKKVLGVSEVQALLDEETTLLSYLILDDQTLAFLLTHDDFYVVELEVSREELTNRISYFRKVIEGRQEKAGQQAGQELYQLLIAPIEQAKAKAEAKREVSSHLIIVPHGVLHYLPFAALQNSETGRYLMQDYSLVILPSASALQFVAGDRRPSAAEIEQGSDSASSPPRLPASPLIVGNPATGDYDAVASLATERAGLAPLPFAEQEAKAIAALYEVEPLIGEAATEGTVREQVPSANIVHLAAHGFYNPYAPLSSLIALAPDLPTSDPQSPISNLQSHDGWLTVGEVYGLDLHQTDLVVLSACETQVGQEGLETGLGVTAGDEVVGLTRAFFFAGTPTVVASLWKIDDEATGRLMERFYIHLKDGLGKAEALRQAQLETKAQQPDPYSWSAFVLSGNGE